MSAARAQHVGALKKHLGLGPSISLSYELCPRIEYLGMGFSMVCLNLPALGSGTCLKKIAGQVFFLVGGKASHSLHRE